MAPLVGDKKVAEGLWRAVLSQKPSRTAIVALYEAAVVESGMRNLEYGDRDSLGVLQQRASWGSRESRLNPEESAVRFLNKAKSFEPWKGTPGGLAQAVQVSAFPLKYDAALPVAMVWISLLGGLSAVDKIGEGVADAVPGKGAVDAVSSLSTFFSERNGLRRIALVVVGGIVAVAGVGLIFGKQITGTIGKVVT